MMIDYFDMVAALTTDYLNVFLAEPENDKAQTVRLEGYVTKGIDVSPECFSYTQMLHAYTQVRVCDEDRGYVTKLLDPENVVKYFEGGANRMEFIYRIMQAGEIHYYSAQVIRVRKRAGMLDVAPDETDSDAGCGFEAEKIADCEANKNPGSCAGADAADSMAAGTVGVGAAESAGAGAAAGSVASGAAVNTSKRKDPLQVVVGFRNVDVLISMMKEIGEEYPSSLLRYMQEYGK